MLNEKQIEQLARHFDGSSSDEDNREIIRWCRENSDHDRIYSELREIWTLTGKIPSDFQPNVQAAWESVSEKIDNYEKVVNKSTGLKSLTYFATRIAAVFVVGFALYFMFELNNNNSDIVLTEQLISTDSVTDVLLADGSRVWLNDNSTLKYSKEFDGEKRIVELEGEAYFEIEKNPEKPFLIKTAFSKTEVLGTSFNYSAYKKDGKDILIVNSGKVRFSETDDESNQVILIKGEKAELDVNSYSITKSLNDDFNYLSWKTGRLTFEDNTLGEIVSDLSNFYKRNFEIRNHSLKSTRLTVTFDNQTLEDVLKVLELTLNVTCSNELDKVIIN